MNSNLMRRVILAILILFTIFVFSSCTTEQSGDSKNGLPKDDPEFKGKIHLTGDNTEGSGFDTHPSDGDHTAVMFRGHILSAFQSEIRKTQEGILAEFKRCCAGMAGFPGE